MLFQFAALRLQAQRHVCRHFPLAPQLCDGGLRSGAGALLSDPQLFIQARCLLLCAARLDIRLISPGAGGSQCSPAAATGGFHN
jgi:hypothetical protein